MKKTIILLCAAGSVFLLSCKGERKHEVVFTDKAPAPIGPYSQAIQSGGSLYISGQIALRKDGTLDTSSVESECRQVLDNIKAIVVAGGKNMNNVVKVSIFCTNLAYFRQINEVYKGYFTAQPPARETVEVSKLPKGARIEISAIAH